MKFIMFIYEFLEPDSYEFVYTGWLYCYKSILTCILDTDSLCLVLTDDMTNLVKPDKLAEWDVQQRAWFVQDETDASDLRRPGKMKLEWHSKNGAIVA